MRIFMKSAAVLTIICLCIYTAHAAFSFYSGNDWGMIDRKTYAPDTKAEMKAIILKTVQSATALTGNPAISMNQTDYRSYASLIDNIYSDESNKDIPVFFAFKMADMKKKGFPDKQINLYKAAIRKKLNPRQ